MVLAEPEKHGCTKASQLPHVTQPVVHGRPGSLLVCIMSERVASSLQQIRYVQRQVMHMGRDEKSALVFPYFVHDPRMWSGLSWTQSLNLGVCPGKKTRCFRHTKKSIAM